jgi:G3E family GTPase
MNNGIPLRIVTGFLGSGKTTLINRILSGMPGKRVGVIVNDFGPVAVDSSLLAGAIGGTLRTGIEIRELNNGQLFCGCLVGSFIDAVDSFAGSDLDALWVEASGLAKPSPLFDTMAEIEKRSGGAFYFRGMACVVDASRFLLLAPVVNAIEEQIAYSRLTIVNKADLVSDSELESVVDAIRSINPGCRIITTVNAVLPQGALEPDGTEAPLQPDDRRYAGWGECGRPIVFSLSGDGAVKEEGLLAFLAELAPQCYRIKGFITTDRGLRYVDCVGAEVKIADPSPGATSTGLVVISAIGDSLRLPAMGHWKDMKAGFLRSLSS